MIHRSHTGMEKDDKDTRGMSEEKENRGVQPPWFPDILLLLHDGERGTST